MQKDNEFDRNLLKVMMRLEDSMNSRKLERKSKTDIIPFERVEQSDINTSGTKKDERN